MDLDEEEDVIFDQAGLLTNRVKNADDVHVHGLRRIKPGRRGGKLCKTFWLCAAFFGLGLCYAILGPTLLDLRERTHTDLGQISRVFIGRSVGYLIGSILGGFLFDRINQYMLLSLSLFLTAVGTALAPWCKFYVLLMACLSFQGLSMGLLDTGGNVMCLQIWGHSSGPYMQAMHFSFGMGAFVAPLIAEPFLAPLTVNDTNTTAFQFNHQLPAGSIPGLLPGDNKSRTRRTVVNPFEQYPNTNRQNSGDFLPAKEVGTFYGVHYPGVNSMHRSPMERTIYDDRDASLQYQPYLNRKEDKVLSPPVSAGILNSNPRIADGSAVGKIIQQDVKNINNVGVPYDVPSIADGSAVGKIIQKQEKNIFQKQENNPNDVASYGDQHHRPNVNSVYNSSPMKTNVYDKGVELFNNQPYVKVNENAHFSEKKKPVLTDAAILNSDSKIADGSDVGKIIQNSDSKIADGSDVGILIQKQDKNNPKPSVSPSPPPSSNSTEPKPKKKKVPTATLR